MSRNDVFRIEAEDFSFKYGFETAADRAFASGEAFVLLDMNEWGFMRTAFTGESGRYKVVINWLDENDGESGVHLDVGGEGRTVWMDGEGGSNRRDARSVDSRATHSEVEIEEGELLTLQAIARGGERAAIDSIDFIRLDAPEPEPAPEPAPAPRPDPAPQPQPPAEASGAETAPALDAFEAEVLRLTNELREDAGLAPLRHDAKLASAAERHSRDMAENDYFSHTNQQGESPGDRISDEGYRWRTYGENIAAGQDTPEEVVTAWYNSAGHRKNMLNPNFEEIGIGWYQEDGDRYGDYWTQNFGTELTYA